MRITSVRPGKSLPLERSENRTMDKLQGKV